MPSWRLSPKKSEWPAVRRLRHLQLRNDTQNLVKFTTYEVKNFTRKSQCGLLKCSKNRAGNNFYSRETKVQSSLTALTYNNASTEMTVSQINKIKSSLWSNTQCKDNVTKGGCQSLWRYTTRMAGGKTSLHTKWQKHQRIKKKNNFTVKAHSPMMPCFHEKQG